MKRITSILSTIGMIVFLIGAATADGESVAVTISIMGIGAAVAALSLLFMKAGERNVH